MVTVVFGHGQVMLFPDEIFRDYIDFAFEYLVEKQIPFDTNQLYFFKRIRDTLSQEPKKDNL